MMHSIAAVKGKDMTLEESKYVKPDLKSAGFVINIEKPLVMARLSD